MTAESQSVSITESIRQEKDGLFQVAYMYQNDPKTELRGVRSEIHYGAMHLAVQTEPERLLYGTYWTDRSTSGTVTVKHTSDKLAQSYSAASELAGISPTHPMSPAS